MTKLNKKQAILIILTLALGLGLVGCGQGPTNTNQNQNTNTNTENTDSSNWQTYKNEEYGFEFKYPKDWIIEELPEKINFYDNEWSLEKNSFRKEMISAQISISYYPNTDDITALIKKMFNLEKYPTIHDATQSEKDIFNYGEEIIDNKKTNYILAGAESPSYFYFFPSQNNKGIIIFEILYTNKLKNYLLSTISF